MFAFVPRGEGYEAEGFGTVYIESQATGTPVVGSSNGGAPEAIGDGGVIVKDEYNPQEVADAIDQLIVDRARRRKYIMEIDNRIDRF